MTPTQIERLLLELSAQARASSWDDRRAGERARILQTLMKQAGWITPSRYSEQANTIAWMIAIHAPSPDWVPLKVQALGCLFAESCSIPSTSPHRRWWQRRQPVVNNPAFQLLARQRAAKLVDQILLDLDAPIVFGTVRSQLFRGRLITPPLCVPLSETTRLRHAIGLM